jgi:hypothetical protein
MNMRRSLWILLAIVALAIGAPDANADSGSVIVSNLSQSPVGVDLGLNAAAQAFTTGGTPGTLSDVVLELLGSAGAVSLSLFSNSSGLPGSSLLSLGTLTPTGSGFAPYTATGSYALAADTTYWVVVDYLGEPSWGYTDSVSFAGTGTLGSFTNSNNGGTTWNGPYTLEEEGAEPYLLEVDATSAVATPEPSSLLLLSMGCLGVLGLMRRKLLS